MRGFSNKLAIKYIQYIFLFLFVAAQVFGQAKKQNPGYYLIGSVKSLDISKDEMRMIDSCMNVFHHSKNDSTRLSSVLFIVENCWNENVWPRYNLWLLNYTEHELNSKNLDKNRKKTLQEYLANALSNQGYYFKRMGESDSALHYYFNALKIVKEIHDKKNEALLYNNMGVVFLNQGNISKAIDYYQKSLKIREDINDQKGVLMSLNNIAFLYDNYGYAERGLIYYEKALNIAEKIGDKVGMSNLLNNLGDILYHNLGDSAKGLDYLKRSLTISRQLGDKSGIAYVLSSLGVIYKNKGLMDSALSCFNQSLALRKELSEQETILSTIRNIADVHFRKGDYKVAEKLAKESYRGAMELGAEELMKNSAELLREIYFKLGDYKQAYLMYDTYFNLYDSSMNMESQKQLITQQFKVDYEKKIAKDSLNYVKEKEVSEYKISQKNAELELQKSRLITLIIGIVILIVVSFLLFNRFKITKQQKQIIEDQKRVVENKQQEIIDSISYAKRIQTAILPPQRLVQTYLPDQFIIYIPKDIVAGDFYWIEKKGDIVFFAAADCTGHGVPGAMVSVVCNNGLNRSLKEYNLDDPGQILDKTRELIIREFEKSDEEVKDGMDISLCALNTITHELKWAGANNPLWIINPERTEWPAVALPFGEGSGGGEIKPNKQPIGKYADPKPFVTHTLQLIHGDTIYVFTDGFQDQFGGDKSKKFKASKLKELLISIHSKSMNEQKSIIERSFQEWKGKLDQVDDVCIIGVRI